MRTTTNHELLKGACHCGCVRITLSRAPLHAIKCNCSLCFRLGALWAHYEASAVVFEGHPANTSAYVWGKETLKTVRCNTCGCVTHWEALSPEAGSDLGVNMNNFGVELVQAIPVRHFDGADTWTYVD